MGSGDFNTLIWPVDGHIPSSPDKQLYHRYWLVGKKASVRLFDQPVVGHGHEGFQGEVNWECARAQVEEQQFSSLGYFKWLDGGSGSGTGPKKRKSRKIRKSGHMKKDSASSSVTLGNSEEVAHKV